MMENGVMLMISMLYNVVFLFLQNTSMEFKMGWAGPNSLVAFLKIYFGWLPCRTGKSFFFLSFPERSADEREVFGMQLPQTLEA